MHSITPPGATAFSAGPCIPLAWVDGNLPAGFPSPAADFAVKRHDLNELLITHPAATFMWRISGQSMIELGIFDGDFTVKQFWRRAGVVQLRPANPTYPAILFKDGQTMTICGVVTATIKRFK